MITPEKLDAWRIVPRALILSYMVMFIRTCEWFMSLPQPNNAQSAFLATMIGAGAAWFGLYVNGGKPKIESNRKGCECE